MGNSYPCQRRFTPDGGLHLRVGGIGVGMYCLASVYFYFEALMQGHLDVYCLSVIRRKRPYLRVGEGCIKLRETRGLLYGLGQRVV